MVKGSAQLLADGLIGVVLGGWCSKAAAAAFRLLYAELVVSARVRRRRNQQCIIIIYSKYLGHAVGS